MIGNSRAIPVAAAFVVGVAVYAPAGRLAAEDVALSLRASVVGAAAIAPLTIELMRWSTDAERAPMLTALTPPPAPAVSAGAAPDAAAGAAGRGGGRAAGRGGRGGGRGGGTAPPASPAARLSGAVRTAPTVGFIWGDGPTGYSIKYAWRSSSEGRERIVLVTDRRLGAHAPSWPAPAVVDNEAEFTVIEIRVDGKGAGEGKSSLAARVVVDADAKTLALDGYAAAPVLLKVTR